MDPALIQQYGLLAVWLGAFIEGETVLLLAGAFSHGGLLQLRGSWPRPRSAFVGTSFFFLVGRRFGPRVTERFPWRPLRCRASTDSSGAGVGESSHCASCMACALQV
jgi:membrane protein DedA with SNARE-associated domain